MAANDNRRKCPTCGALSEGGGPRVLAPQQPIWCACSDHCALVGCKCACHPENKKRQRARAIRRQNG